MGTKEVSIISFLKELLRKRKCLPIKLADDLGISHTTVSRWLAGKDVPSTQSCRKLAEYSGVSLLEVLSLSGHMPERAKVKSSDWPEFREYARQKYPDELDEDLVTMIEDLIERRRARGYGNNNPDIRI